ncbi:signal transduction histidine kinase [Allocatelliglobosispora scoriae]|uniref:histidine kinase n=1 Tax=Allocatelliglobosispora scoriae TaxID=643052 RepID=A0A841BGX1_9ACTN|nr:histidine kinase [Allocatelliglobosispora scoriae]MBB5866885.1 signal transduction histidine kinase [Allocatelliglobosispora scoriae]
MPGGRTIRTLVGVLLGMPLAVVELALVTVGTPLRLIGAARTSVDRAVARLIALERARLAAWFDHGTTRTGGPGYLAVRAALGIAAAAASAPVAFLSALFLGGALWEVISGRSSPVPVELPGVKLATSSWALGLALAALLAAVAVLLLLAVGAAERRLADRFLNPDGRETMRRRIAELTATRSGIVRAVDDERRRIERDLHDGVQQRGVALAVLLGRARHATDATTTAALLDQAYAESRHLLDELRSVAWRIYPTALDELGLRAALAGVAERSPVPVTVHDGLTERPVSAVETALYFVAREAITNAVKHAGAHDILVILTCDDQAVRVVISDDGSGGADPSGSGLAGLARRCRALDGDLTVDSPVGGPTTVTATLPRAAPCD